PGGDFLVQRALNLRCGANDVPNPRFVHLAGIEARGGSGVGSRRDRGAQREMLSARVLGFDPGTARTGAGRAARGAAGAVGGGALDAIDVEPPTVRNAVGPGDVMPVLIGDRAGPASGVVLPHRPSTGGGELLEIGPESRGRGRDRVRDQSEEVIAVQARRLRF